MKSLNQKIRELGRGRQGKIEARTAELIAEEMSLRDLRHALQQTQKSVAARLGMGQDGISRLEKRSDLLLSTLRNYVKAVGGDLQLIARFPDREPVKILGLEMILSSKEEEAKRKKAARASA